MSTGTRLRSGTVYGTLSDALLTNSSGATTMNSAGLGTAFVPGISGSQYMPVILDPQQQNGAPEIVWVTAHTSTATTATVVRAQEGSTLRAHLSGEFWVAGPTPMDYFPWNWTSYTPTWTASVSNPSIGNGTLIGSYTIFGTTCSFNIYILFGPTTSGGLGFWSLTLPASSASGFDQEVICKAQTTGGGGSLWVGAGIITSASSVVLPILPVSFTASNQSNVQNTDASGGTGHGIPNTGSNYPFTANANLIISGTYQTS